MSGVQGDPRLLNHSRFPTFRKYRRSVRCRAQPLYLLTPSGRFALCATAHRADASLRCASSRFGPLAQVPTGHTLPFAPCRGLGQTPGRSIVAEGAGRAHRSFRSPPSGRFALRATAHRADASLRCPKPCAAAQKSERCECPKGTRNAPRSNTLLSCMTHKRRGHPPPGGAAPLLFKKHYHLERPAFLAPLRSLATLDGLCRRKRWRPPASSCIKPRFLRPGCSIIRASLTVALMVSLSSQISAFCALAARSPCICSFANIGVLRADRAQPLYLLTPSGRFAAFGGNSPQG